MCITFTDNFIYFLVSFHFCRFICSYRSVSIGSLFFMNGHSFSIFPVHWLSKFVPFPCLFHIQLYNRSEKTFEICTDSLLPHVCVKLHYLVFLSHYPYNSTFFSFLSLQHYRSSFFRNILDRTFRFQLASLLVSLVISFFPFLLLPKPLYLFIIAFHIK